MAKNYKGNLFIILSFVIGIILLTSSWIFWKTDYGFLSAVNSDIFGLGLLLFLGSIIYKIYRVKL